MHGGPQPLILPNVWDAASARVSADAGFAALATSSAAMAAALGYRDGQTPGDEMLAAAARIARSVGVPVTVDVESGYGLSPAELVARLADAGVIGCNLEDSDPAARALADPARQAGYLAAIRAEAGQELVINARVDAFMRQPPRSAGAEAGPAVATAVDEAVARAGRYLAAGADCVYPILAPPEALAELVQRIPGPVNAMFVPDGPSLAELAGFGVARITFGSGLYTQVPEVMRALARDLAADAARLAPGSLARPGRGGS